MTDKELDAAVAKAIGWKAGRRFTPSTNIADAWKVVEKIEKKEAEIYICKDDGGWAVTFGEAKGMSSSVTKAICYAALEATKIHIEGD